MDPFSLMALAAVLGVAGPAIAAGLQEPPKYPTYPEQEPVEAPRQWARPSQMATAAGLAMMQPQEDRQMLPYPDLSQPPPMPTPPEQRQPSLYPQQQGAGMVQPEQVFGSLYPGMGA